MEEAVSVTRKELESAIRSLDLWSMRVPDAFALAEQVHAEQCRAGGGPYLEEHIYPVTLTVARFLGGHDLAEAREAVMVALLHDTVEDSTAVTIDLIEARFGQGVARRVQVLTKPKKRPGTTDGMSEDDEATYVRGIREADFATRAIKVLDRVNNLAAVHDRDLERRRRYLAETRSHYLDLAATVDPSLASLMRDLLAAQSVRLDTADER